MELSEKENQTMEKKLKKLKKEQKYRKKDSLVITFTGDGKGKTSSALGTMIRMLRADKQVLIIQFMKDPSKFQYAEKKHADIESNLTYVSIGSGFTWDTKDKELDRENAQSTFLKAKEYIFSDKYDLVILDEILYIIHYGYLHEKLLLDLLWDRPKNVNIVLTGRNASDKVIDASDIVTEMKNVKHIYETEGVLAQRGIDW